MGSKTKQESLSLQREAKKHLEAKFNIGQTTGRKLEAETVAREMRRSVGPDGNRLFGVAEFLSPQQIASFFSRDSMKVRQNVAVVLPVDVLAAEEELHFNDAHQDILSRLQLEHPIVYDQYNICEMVRDGSLNKQKLPVLKLMCNKFELEVPVVTIRKKAQYIVLL